MEDCHLIEQIMIESIMGCFRETNGCSASQRNNQLEKNCTCISDIIYKRITGESGYLIVELCISESGPKIIEKKISNC